MNPFESMLDNIQRFIQPDPETGPSTTARILHVGSKVVGLLGIIVFLIGIALLLNTIQDEDTLKVNGMVTEIEDLSPSLQRISIEYKLGATTYTQTDTTDLFKNLPYKEGDVIPLLVDTEAGQAIITEALPGLRLSFLRTSGFGVLLILVAWMMRRISKRNPIHV